MLGEFVFPKFSEGFFEGVCLESLFFPKFFPARFFKGACRPCAHPWRVPLVHRNQGHDLGMTCGCAQSASAPPARPALYILPCGRALTDQSPEVDLQLMHCAFFLGRMTK